MAACGHGGEDGVVSAFISCSRFAKRVVRREQNAERGQIENHPVAGEAAPLQNWRIRTARSAGRSVQVKDEKIHKGISKEKIDEKAKSVGRAIQNLLPEIGSLSPAKPPLGNEYCGEKDRGNTDVKAPKEGVRGYLPAQQSADVDPKTNKETNQREKSEKSDQWPRPSWKRFAPAGGLWSARIRSAVLQERIDRGFKDKRRTGAVWTALNGNALAAKTAKEIIGFLF